MEQDAPPPPPPPSTSSPAAAVTGVGDPSSSLADTLRHLMPSARPDLHSLLPPPPPERTAGIGDPSSSTSAAHALRRLASSAQPELTHSSPSSLVPPPPPSPWSSESASTSASSSAAVTSYQQRPPTAAPVLDGSSLHARSLSQAPPVFSSLGNILSTDLQASAAPLGNLGGQMPQQAPPQSTTHDMLFGQSNNLFGVAPQHSSFLSSPGTMGNTLFTNLGAPPITHLSLLGSQQQQALPTQMTPGMLLRGSDSFCGFGRQPMLGSSSRSGCLPPRWQPPSRRETNPTFGSVQPSCDELVRLPPSLQMPPPRQEAPGFTLPDTSVTSALTGPFVSTQPLPGRCSSFSSWESRLGGGAHTLSAWSTYGSVSNNGRSSAAIMSTEPWHCRNYLSGESSSTMMSAMPRPLSVGGKASLVGPPPPPSKGRKRRGDTFTDAEMEKIRKDKRLSDLVITDPRRVKTILCNRESAAKSAERRKSYRTGLQQQLQALEIEYTQLHGQAILQQEKLAELESQTSKLRMRLEDLHNELNLKEAINETLTSSIQSITLADSNAWSGLPQQMNFDGQF